MKEQFKFIGSSKSKDFDDLFFEQGIVFLEKEGRKYLHIMLAHLQKHFLVSFRKALALYPEGREITERIKSNVVRVKKLSQAIDSLLADKDGKIDVDVVKEMILQFQNLASEAVMIEKEASKSKEFKKLLKQVEEETGVSFKMLSTESKVMGKKMGQMIGETPSAGGKFGFIKDHFTDELDKVKDFGSTMADALLGPFSPFLKGGFGAARSAFRTIRDWRIQKQAKKLGGGLSNRTQGLSDDELEAQDFSTTPIGKEANKKQINWEEEPMPVNNVRENWSLAAQTGPQPRNKKGEYKVRPGKAQLEAAALPMWYFFDKLAYKAKWTKEVLRLLREKQKRKNTDRGNFLEGMLGGLAVATIPWILPIVSGVIVALGLGWLLQKHRPKSTNEKMKEDIERWEAIKRGDPDTLMTKATHDSLEWVKEPTVAEKVMGTIKKTGGIGGTSVGLGGKVANWIKTGKWGDNVSAKTTAIEQQQILDRVSEERNKIDNAVPENGFDSQARDILLQTQEQNKHLKTIVSTLKKQTKAPEKRNAIDQYDASSPVTHEFAKGLNTNE